ncbi:hypothetical protein EDD37DRAFT_561583 [Exophiala viscosa]|uniref:Uncharacterized protein n=1 Tax=Exophiala viscosa TaxID=2486360 RepID=A0AAN6ID89_9EURO|nr:hypothetical protein EDD36DRAFT_383096 [Exophiala viscosa]KAI1626297.1 hypothetical protein EDD37DRAFT_561583 [Exophiala viscosa]
MSGLDNLINISTLERGLQLLGAVTAASTVFKVLSLARLYLSPSSISVNRWKHGNPYALVTGATDGIGFGIAEALAARSFNIILHGRDRNKLEARRATLQKQHPGLRTEILVFDVLKDPYDDIENLISGISHLNITILVNNVGGIPFMPAYINFTEFDSSQIDAVIDINARFLAHFTRYMMPILSKNGPALIMNIGSAAQIGVPGATMYSGTKGFVLSFSEALARECKISKTPVDVLNINLGDVSSKSTPTPVKFGNPLAKDFGRDVIARVGAAIASDRNTVTPHIPHAILFGVLKSLPEFVKVAFMRNIIQDARALHRKIFNLKEE